MTSEKGTAKPRYFEDREAAREAGRKGAAISQERARLKAEDPEAYVRATFEAKRAELSKELLDAALGTGSWSELEPAKRLTALFRAMEYAVGRPTARKDAEPQTEEAVGLAIE